MNEHPIIFSAEMVRAILDGRKTQTRRIIKPQPALSNVVTAGYANLADRQAAELQWLVEHRCPYGQPGDLLWVRESFSPYLFREGFWYWADGNVAQYDATRPKPSIHMPRYASRITLEIVNVRAERVQEIITADIIAEGVLPDEHYLGSANRYRHAFESLWDSINARRGFGWDVNPYVWVIEFKRMKP